MRFNNTIKNQYITEMGSFFVSMNVDDLTHVAATCCDDDIVTWIHTPEVTVHFMAGDRWEITCDDTCFTEKVRAFERQLFLTSDHGMKDEHTHSSSSNDRIAVRFTPTVRHVCGSSSIMLPAPTHLEPFIVRGLQLIGRRRYLWSGVEADPSESGEKAACRFMYGYRWECPVLYVAELPL